MHGSVSFSATSQFAKDVGHLCKDNSSWDELALVFEKQYTRQKEFMEEICTTVVKKISIELEGLKEDFDDATKETDLLHDTLAEFTQVANKSASNLKNDKPIGNVQKRLHTFMETNEKQLNEINAYKYVEDFHRSMATVAGHSAHQETANKDTASQLADPIKEMQTLVKTLKDGGSRVSTKLLQSKLASIMSSIRKVHDEAQITTQQEEISLTIASNKKAAELNKKQRSIEDALRARTQLFEELKESNTLTTAQTGMFEADIEHGEAQLREIQEEKTKRLISGFNHTKNSLRLPDKFPKPTRRNWPPGDGRQKNARPSPTVKKKFIPV